MYGIWCVLLLFYPSNKDDLVYLVYCCYFITDHCFLTFVYASEGYEVSTVQMRFGQMKFCGRIQIYLYGLPGTQFCFIKK